ncbi:MAG: hypothetical protein GDA36_03170 [Rhodobacteraceae bacterium]|nr:hypothetical protein [Paracoccaceae bacterium]
MHLFLCGFLCGSCRTRIGADDVLTGIDAPQDRAEEEPPDDPPVHFNADTQARRLRNGSKTTPGYKDKIQRLCPPGRVPDEESFIDKVHTGTCETPQLRTGPGATGVRYHGQRGERAGGYWPTRPIPARPTGTPCAVTTVTGSCERPPVIAPCGLRKNAGAGGSPNAAWGIEQCLCHDDAPPDISGWPQQNAQLAMAAIGRT